MTVEEYYAIVHKLKLTPKTQTVYLDSEQNCHHVPDPRRQTPPQRIDTLRILCRLLGENPSEYNL